MIELVYSLSKWFNLKIYNEPLVHIHRVPRGPTFPTFSKFCPHFIKKIPTFPTFLREPFLEDGYGSILTKKCVIINVRMLKGFCTPCLRSSISFQIHRICQEK